MHLIELSNGVFINLYQVVQIRVVDLKMVKEEWIATAFMSNGDNFPLSKEDWRKIRNMDRTSVELENSTTK